MNWLEMIEIRATDHKCSRLSQHLENILNEIRKEEGDRVQVMRHLGYSTDYCILIMHCDPEPEPCESSMALNLIAGLRDIGMVNHNVWIPLGQKPRREK